MKIFKNKEEAVEELNKEGIINYEYDEFFKRFIIYNDNQDIIDNYFIEE